MATAKVAPPRATEVRKAAGWRGYAFGLEIEASSPLRGVMPTTSTPGTRRVIFERVESTALDEARGAVEPEQLVHFRYANGRLMMRIDALGPLGFEIRAPRHGRHLVSADGTVVRSALPADRSRRWERLVAAQVLPLAAALQGLEPLHASAVSLDDRTALAFVAPSGTGKTSIAVHLVSRGATLVTDDVLAVEGRGHDLLAHPGIGLLNVDPTELGAVGATRGTNRHAGVGADKIQVTTHTVERALPLTGIYFLRTADRGERLRVDASAVLDARRLLATTFLRYLRSPGRLVAHLDACARIGAAARAFEVVLPTGTLAADASAVIREHAEAL
jgi:hypothetical protein